MKIVEYSSSRAIDIANVFHQSVHAIDNSIYSPEQKNAWAPLPIDYEKWKKRLELKRPFLLLINEHIAGFIELDPDGYIDCVYVSPKYQRKGVATSLLNHVISFAKHSSLDNLYVEASIISKPLFERFGFEIEKKNKIVRNNIVLINYSMWIEI